MREAGAEKVNERAVISLEKELEDTVKELMAEASVYANYAGRKRIKRSDIVLLHRNGLKARRVRMHRYPRNTGRQIRSRPDSALVEAVAVRPNI